MPFSALALALALAANPHLEAGRRLYEQLKYPEAEARLKIAAESPTNTAADQAEIADLLARALIAQGRPADAERTWAELLAKQPDAPDPSRASPKIRDVFARAKRSVYPEDFVRLERRAAAGGRFEADLVDPWRHVASVTFNGAPQPEGRHFAGELPKGKSTLEAKSNDGHTLASLEWTRNEVVQVPLADVSVGVVEVPKGPTRWPAIVTGVLAVAGIAAGTALAISSAQDYGRVTPETDAATTAALDGRARSKALGRDFAFGGAAAAGVVTAVLIWSW